MAFLVLGRVKPLRSSYCGFRGLEVRHVPYSAESSSNTGAPRPSDSLTWSIGVWNLFTSLFQQTNCSNKRTESAVRMPPTPPGQTFQILVYYPTHALRNRTHVTCINSYMFRHRDVIIRELLQLRRKSQPATIFIYQDRVCLYWEVGFMHMFVHNLVGWLYAYIGRFGLYTFVVITRWWWHLGAETCRGLCMSCVLYHNVHLLGKYTDCKNIHGMNNIQF